MVTLIRGRVYAFRDRRVRKREFRRLWIVRINAACRMRGLRYGQLIAGLQRAMVELDRKTLANLAIEDPDTFTKIVELAQGQPAAGVEITQVASGQWSSVAARTAAADHSATRPLRH